MGKGRKTDIVEINIYSAKMGKDEVTDRVGALDGKRIVVECAKEPGILCGNEFARFLVGPELWP